MLLHVVGNNLALTGQCHRRTVQLLLLLYYHHYYFMKISHQSTNPIKFRQEPLTVTRYMGNDKHFIMHINYCYRYL